MHVITSTVFLEDSPKEEGQGIQQAAYGRNMNVIKTLAQSK